MASLGGLLSRIAKEGISLILNHFREGALNERMGFFSFRSNSGYVA
jgi:hypothetical protein